MPPSRPKERPEGRSRSSPAAEMAPCDCGRSTARRGRSPSRGTKARSGAWASRPTGGTYFPVTTAPWNWTATWLNRDPLSSIARRREGSVSSIGVSFGLAARIGSGSILRPSNRSARYSSPRKARSPRSMPRASMSRAIASGGQVIWQRHAVPELPISRVRQVLFDEWTQSERIQEFARQTYAAAETTYDALPVWAKAVFWPALLWQLTILGATGLWVVRPHLLAQWAMPAIGTPQIPTWQWLAGALTLFGFLGTTRRPLAAWLRKNRADLFEQCFAGREPVTERERYCPLIHDADIAAFGGAVAVGTPVRVWITGVGGNGKSALFSSPMTPWPSCSRPGGRSRAGRV